MAVTKLREWFILSKLSRCQAEGIWVALKDGWECCRIHHYPIHMTDDCGLLTPYRTMMDAGEVLGYRGAITVSSSLKRGKGAALIRGHAIKSMECSEANGVRCLLPGR